MIATEELNAEWMRSSLLSWAEFVHRQRPEVKAAYQKAYSQRPEVKAYQKAYSQRPEVKAHRKAYRLNNREGKPKIILEE